MMLKINKLNGVFITFSVFLLTFLLTFSVSFFANCNSIEKKLRLPVKGLVRIDKNAENFNLYTKDFIMNEFGIVDDIMINAKLTAFGNGLEPYMISGITMPEKNEKAFTVYGVSRFDNFPEFLFSERVLTEGNYPDKTEMKRGTTGAVIDSETAKLNGLSKGDKIMLTFSEEVYDISTGTPLLEEMTCEYIITGIANYLLYPSGFETKASDIKQNCIFIPYDSLNDTYRALCKKVISAGMIDVKTDTVYLKLSEYRAAKQLENVLNALSTSDTMEYTFTSLDEEREQETAVVLQLLNITRAMLITVGVTAVFIYAFESKYVVTKHRREYMIRRAIGFSKKQIILGILFPYAAFSSIGAFFGAVLSAFLSHITGKEILSVFQSAFKGGSITNTTTESVLSKQTVAMQITNADNYPTVLYAFFISILSIVFIAVFISIFSIHSMAKTRIEIDSI